MKTTIEMPDPVFREAKAVAARQGISLKDFVTAAVEARLKGSAGSAEKPWMRSFGGLRHLHRENKRIDRVIADEFESIDEDEWR